MEAAPAASVRLTRQVERLGVAALVGVALLSALLWWLGVTGESPVLPLAVPAFGLAALVVAVARPGPTAAFAVVVAGSVALMGGEAGLSLLEVAFGLGAMAYLALWTVRAAIASEGVLRSSADVAAALWCVLGIAGGVALGIAFGADPYDFRSDLQAALFFPFYFPAKEVVRRSARGPQLVLALVLGLGLCATLINLIGLRAALASATAVYEIVDVRVPDGMVQISAAMVVALAVLATPQSVWVRAVVLGMLAALAVGLVIGKSRAFWVAVVLAVGVLGVLLPRAGRLRLGVALGVSIVGIVGLGALVVGDQLALIGAGAVDRLLSLRAGGQDVSLATRAAETEAAFARIVQNPILGHGWGTQVTHYSALSDGTRSWAFLHNGYVALWFKLGIWGLALMLVVWLATLVRGAWTLRFARLLTDERALLTGAVATLSVFMLTAITSSPFSIMDQMLMVGLLLGAANGVVQRVEDREAGALPGPDR